MENGFFGRAQKPYQYNRGMTVLTGFPYSTTPVDGITLANQSTALINSSSSVSTSPALNFTGRAFGTSTQLSSPVSWRIYMVPSPSNPPSSVLNFDTSSAGAAYNTRFSFNSSGGATFSGSSLTANGVAVGSSDSYAFATTRSKLSSSGDGLLELFNSTANGFTRLDFGGTTSSFPAIGRNGIILEVLAADGAATASLAVYNTKTSTTNFERLDVQWAVNVCQVWTEKGSGGGTARDLVLGADATELERFQTGSKIGWFGATPVVRQTSGANLTNNVTAGGTTDQIDDFSSLTVYSVDAAAIRNDIYQLARKLKQINDGLRALGLFT